ncbi:MAG: hypothetical protein EOM23_01350, partial [Candidatus Moranbacteria bacterium]|nr:hypothetical protein [Candidatus Moranbacteria bacterium]
LYGQYRLWAEMGHNYFHFSHIAEAMIAENYGTRYYLTHWSDIAIRINKYIVSYLACEKFCVWGSAHIRNVEGGGEIYELIGYPFKKRVSDVKGNRFHYLKCLGLPMRGKVMAFFDESFGAGCKMTAVHYMNFWKTIRQAAELFLDCSIVIKPKEFCRYKNLPMTFQKEFLHIVNQLKEKPNVFFIDEKRWSFIEVIGVSDVVVSQGMTSSSTIALICGINGLYLDEARYAHPFRDFFKDVLVFDHGKLLLAQLSALLHEPKDLTGMIPQKLMRGFDAYLDDCGADRIRQILLKGSFSRCRTQGKIGVIIQARMGSTRLPGKVMMKIEERSLLEILLRRLKKVQKVDSVIVATTTSPQDDIIVQCARNESAECFRGEHTNVLKRYYDAARKFQLDTIIRVTSDCPLMDPQLINRMLDGYFDTSNFDYLSNTLARTFPRGFDIEIFSFYALENAYVNACEDYQREHVTPWIIENMRTENYADINDHSRFRVTVDTIEDFELVKKVFHLLGGVDESFNYSDVTKLLMRHPDLVKINQNILQKPIHS